MGQFRKKPIVIDAIQFDMAHWGEMCDFAPEIGEGDDKPHGVWLTEDGREHEGGGIPAFRIPTLEGIMYAREGDWVIRGVAGELYPCKPDIFEATYEPVAG